VSDLIGRAAQAETRSQRELSGVPSWIWDGTSLPVPIELIAEDHYGLLVESRHSLQEFATRHDVHVSGVLLKSTGRILVDALEAARAPGRRRFTIAHELGHLVLHDGVGPGLRRPVSRESAARIALTAVPAGPAALAYPPQELEANQFAAAMLMPADHLAVAGIACPLELADLCRVSLAAAEKRLEYLRWCRSWNCSG